MAKRVASARSPAAERTDLYQQITDTIISQLEAGRFPWVQPWADLPGAAGVSMPRNAGTGRVYSGVNVMLLWASGIAAGYPSQSWLTFRQALSLGGCVRKGEHGTPIVYADAFVPKDERHRASRDGDEARTIPFLKRFTAFNIAQCKDLPEALTAPPPPPRQDLILPRFRALMDASGVTIRIGGSMAFYRPADDIVVLPPPEAFHEHVNFHRTAAHELGHASGHSSRLDRLMKTRHGSPCYAREELVAEICAAYVCASLGIVPTVRHADYLASWLEVLREDKHAIIRAASQASKAANWLLDRLPPEYALATGPNVSESDADPASADAREAA